MAAAQSLKNFLQNLRNIATALDTQAVDEWQQAQALEETIQANRTMVMVTVSEPQLRDPLPGLITASLQEIVVCLTGLGQGTFIPAANDVALYSSAPVAQRRMLVRLFFVYCDTALAAASRRIQAIALGGAGVGHIATTMTSLSISDSANTPPRAAPGPLRAAAVVEAAPAPPVAAAVVEAAPGTPRAAAVVEASPGTPPAAPSSVFSLEAAAAEARAAAQAAAQAADRAQGAANAIDKALNDAKIAKK